MRKNSPEAAGNLSYLTAGIVAILISAFVIGNISGYVMAFFSMRMKLAGIPTQTIGFATSIQLSALVAVTLILPKFLHRTNLFIFHLCACIAGMVAFFGLFFADNDIWVHYGFRFLLGCGIAALYIICELWLNAAVQDAHRGKVLGMYGMLIVLGMGGSPRIVPVIGTDGLMPFLIGVSFFAAAFLPLLFVAKHAPQGGSDALPTSSSILNILKLSPSITFAGLMFGISDSSMSFFMPIYGLSEGLSKSDSAFLLTCIFWGGVLMQIPAGWMADRIPTRIVLLMALSIGVAGCAIVPYLIGAPGWLLWLHMAIWGGIMTTIYVIALTAVGREFKETHLATAILTFGLMYGAGGMVGPTLAGQAMEQFGPNGLPGLVAVVCSLSILFNLFRMMKGHAR